MNNYHNLILDIIENGAITPAIDERTGTGTKKVFGRLLQYPLWDKEKNQNILPLITTKRMIPNIVFTELCWMLRGDTNTQYLLDNNVTIWDEWADANGDLGNIYGYQWRNWETSSGTGVPIDQIKNLIHRLQTDPYSRRHIVSAWNVGQLTEMNLPPCHVLFQFSLMPPEKDGDKKRLSCMMYQRSADVFLGLPYNIAFYATLTMLIAKQIKAQPHELTIALGDAHIYLNHFEQCMTQLARPHYELPSLLIADHANVFNADPAMFSISNYQFHPTIKAPIAV